MAVALGSNLGDRAATLTAALERLRRLLDDLRASSYHETEPAGVEPGSQPPYLNAAVVGTTRLPPGALLERLLALEAEFGRTRPFANAPRTLDLDLILYGDLSSSRPGLKLPHPRFRERPFVLEPLAEIAPDLVDPVTGRTVEQLREALAAGGTGAGRE